MEENPILRILIGMKNGERLNLEQILAFWTEAELVFTPLDRKPLYEWTNRLFANTSTSVGAARARGW